MAKQRYRDLRMSDARIDLVDIANEIIEEYQAQGYRLTLRQLYYRFVAAGHLPNKDSEYKRLGDVLNDARYAGLVDWDAIEDRTRNLAGNTRWDSPEQMIQAAYRSYYRDKWEGQDTRVEVWVEKQALEGIVAQVCREVDVDYIACRGYMSASEMRAAALRFIQHEDEGKRTVILHLGDHDPSGVDMTRDIQDRLREFCEADGFDGPDVERIALNMDQIRAYNPPPNPAKLTDSRCTGYMAEYGNQSWELDALPPQDLADLIRTQALAYRRSDPFRAVMEREQTEKALLRECHGRWTEVCAVLAGGAE